jgi:serine/threonine protein kinase
MINWISLEQFCFVPVLGSGNLWTGIFDKVKNVIVEIGSLLAWNANSRAFSEVDSFPAHTPKTFKFLTNGADKDIYVDPSRAASATSQKVYLVGRRNFFEIDPLAGEIEKTKEIKKRVYFGALVKFFINQNESAKNADRLAKEVLKDVPTLDDLVNMIAQEPKSKAVHGEGISLLMENATSSAIQRLLNCYAHLALEFDEEPGIQIDQRSPVYSTLRAKNNLEEEVRSGSHTFSENLAMIGQLIDGFDCLHAGGIVLNDPKLENMLFYKIHGKAVVKISDWGRATQLSEGSYGLYLGNRRHMPPERLSSLKGEVFGIGMMFVRILEEEFLRQSDCPMLCDPVSRDLSKEKQLKNDYAPEKRRKGIERFLSVLSGSPHIDVKPIDIVSHLIYSFGAFLRTPSANLKMDQEIEKYLNELEAKLLEKYRGDGYSRQIRETVSILRDMLKSEPAQRLSMKEVSQRWASILDKKAI